MIEKKRTYLIQDLIIVIAYTQLIVIIVVIVIFGIIDSERCTFHKRRSGIHGMDHGHRRYTCTFWDVG